MLRFGILNAALILMITFGSQLLDADETTKIVLIGKERDHPPQTHEYLHECGLLAKCLEQTEGVEAIVSNGWPTDPAILDGVDSIVFYTANGGDVLFDPSHRDETDELLAGRVGIVLLHWGTAASPGENGELTLKTMGGWFHSSFSEIPVVESAIRPADPTHPISRGWLMTPMKDEYYIKLRYLDAAKPVVKAVVNGVDYPVGWILEREDGGRSFGYVCGHFHDCFAIPAFRRSVVNGILWTAGVEIPKSGASVDITPEDLVLPPDPRVDGD